MALRISRRHWIIGSSLAALVGVGVWVVVSLRNSDSGLSVLVKYTARAMWLTPPETTAEVLERMLSYEKRGRLEDAAKLGIAWTDRDPRNYSSNDVYVNLAFIRLEEATRDKSQADARVEQAIAYRDKALACSPDALDMWVNAARISEFAGDYSETQRCIQYGNAVKLLNQISVRMETEQHLNGTLTQDKRNEIEGKLHKKISSVQQKLRDAKCQ